VAGAAERCPAAAGRRSPKSSRGKSEWLQGAPRRPFGDGWSAGRAAAPRAACVGDDAGENTLFGKRVRATRHSLLLYGAILICIIKQFCQYSRSIKGKVLSLTEAAARKGAVAPAGIYMPVGGAGSGRPVWGTGPPAAAVPPGGTGLI